MIWVICVGAVLLVAVLACVFLKNARTIRRDMDERFRHIEAELEHEANSVVKDLFNHQKRT